MLPESQGIHVQARDQGISSSLAIDCIACICNYLNIQGIYPWSCRIFACSSWLLLPGVCLGSCMMHADRSWLHDADLLLGFHFQGLSAIQSHQRYHKSLIDSLNVVVRLSLLKQDSAKDQPGDTPDRKVHRKMDPNIVSNGKALPLSTAGHG